MKKIIFLFVFLFVCVLTLLSQSEKLFRNFENDKIVFNPSYVGMDGKINFILLYRTYMQGLNGSSNLASFTLEVPINSSLSGIAAGYKLYENDWVINHNFNLSFAYSFKIKDSYLSIGVSPKFSRYYSNPEVSYWGLGRVNFDYDVWSLRFGTSFRYKTFHIGFSYMERVAKTIRDDSGIYDFDKRQIYLNSGYDFKIRKSDLILMPSILMRYDRDLVDFAFLAMLGYKNKIKLGLNYCTDREVSPIVEFTLFDALTFGYSYSFFSNFNNGKHEFLIKIGLLGRNS